jgi:acyl-coenzyme A thioesterase PaaI-like protein
MSAAAETSARIVSAASLLGPGVGAGSADPARCSAAAVEALSAVAGAWFGMTSLALDVASAKLGGGEIEVRAQTDKRTRSIVFASAEAWQGEQLVFSAQGLFSRREGK